MCDKLLSLTSIRLLRAASQQAIFSLKVLVECRSVNNAKASCAFSLKIICSLILASFVYSRRLRSEMGAMARGVR